MKFLLRAIWNFFIGYRNGFVPKTLYEHIPQYPVKFWCSPLWINIKNNNDFALVFVDDRSGTEITPEIYWNMYKSYLKDREKWYKAEFENNHTEKEKRFLKIHYWLNDMDKTHDLT